MVDLNAPWRIIADIESEGMREVAQRYGYYGTNSMFKKAYKNPTYIDILSFVQSLVSLYEACKVDSYAVTESCSNGSSRTNRVVPEVYTAADLMGIYGVEYFMQFYAYLRLFEERPELSDIEMKHIVEQVIEVSRIEGTPTALTRYLESIINEEVDKMGSFDYIKKSSDIRKEQEIYMNDHDVRPENYRYASIARKELLFQQGKNMDEDLNLLADDILPPDNPWDDGA